MPVTEAETLQKCRPEVGTALFPLSNFISISDTASIISVSVSGFVQQAVFLPSLPFRKLANPVHYR